MAWCRARFAYEGPAARVVTAIKYRQGLALVDWLAQAMTELVGAGTGIGPGNGPGIGPGADANDVPIDIVTWAPTSAERRRRRGFDQAERLAVAVGRQLRIPVIGCLRRLPGSAQTGADLLARQRGPCFVATFPGGAGRRPVRRQGSFRDGLVVAVVDDVVTTGATMAAAAAALHAARAQLTVVGLAGVHTARLTPMLRGHRGLAEPAHIATVSYDASWAQPRSVVASRSQSQAKRPT